jgi:hypothetical protein
MSRISSLSSGSETIPLPRARVDLLKSVYFFFAFFLPFSKLGPELADYFWLCPAIVFGAIIGARVLVELKVSKAFFTLVVLLFYFWMSSIYRSPASNYVNSLLAFALVTLPLGVDIVRREYRGSLINGFLLGLVLVLTLVYVEVFSQFLGLTLLHGALVDLLGYADVATRSHNGILGYIRPYATFPEPAYLAMYLIYSLLILDAIDHVGFSALRLLIFIAVLLAGSLVGYVLAMAYFATKYLADLRTHLFSFKGASYTFLFLAACAASVSYLEVRTGFLSGLSGRFDTIFYALSMSSHEGSEGSRLNSYLVVFDYIREEGLFGALFGEGYGNYDTWIAQHYSYLTRNATLGRGQIDNILVATVLNAGFIGLVLYLAFIISCLRGLPRHLYAVTLAIFILFNFASGFLLSYVTWYSLAMVIWISRFDYTRVDPGAKISAGSSPKGCIDGA